ncbi:TetR/AcrR family transcriptional regulator [Arenicella xantha]|uniref:TetR family transcriptional regulator n=1 Tax=Arenicella xantha TaxID=644221 RepID=A0A395JK25_9GAMM|nr:TetR/AcrR family transcriptional regulator [Arenicella xantha]RBP50879.1 TetR family transcriptional regulator [Arenicella xantha]
MNNVANQREPRRTQAQRTEMSDQRMLDATVKLIVERGPSATSLTDVGVLAGYSRGLASHRFGSKDNLFNFVVLKLGEMWLAKLKEVTNTKSGLAAIEHAIDQHYDFCVDAPDHVRTLYTLWFESLNSDSELSATIKAIHQRRFQDVVNWIVHDERISERAKKEADVIAAQFSASIIGVVYYWLANPEKLNETKSLHDGLKLTMTRLLSEETGNDD